MSKKYIDRFLGVISLIGMKLNTEKGRTCLIVTLVIDFLVCILCTILHIYNAVVDSEMWDVHLLNSGLSLIFTVLMYNIIITFCKSEVMYKESEWLEKYMLRMIEK